MNLNMGNEKAVRIQTSVLNALEKKLLVAIANRMPRKVTSDTLTLIGVLGAVVCFIGFLLSNISLQFLWLVIIGLFVNWYGDSLDGTVARVRNTQRPLYGYYLDHNVDVLNEALLFIGAGLSPLISLPVALFCLTGYSGLDPDVNVDAAMNSNYPTLGMDYGAYHRARTFTVGLNVKF